MNARAKADQTKTLWTEGFKETFRPEGDNESRIGLAFYLEVEKAKVRPLTNHVPSDAIGSRILSSFNFVFNVVLDAFPLFGSENG